MYHSNIEWYSPIRIPLAWAAALSELRISRPLKAPKETARGAAGDDASASKAEVGAAVDGWWHDRPTDGWGPHPNRAGQLADQVTCAPADTGGAEPFRLAAHSTGQFRREASSAARDCVPHQRGWQTGRGIGVCSAARFGPLSQLFQFHASAEHQFAHPSWCFVVSTTYLAPASAKSAAHLKMPAMLP